MRRLEPCRRARFAVVVDRVVELAVPSAPVAGVREHLVVQDDDGYKVVEDTGCGRPVVMDGWTVLGTVTVQAGQAVVQDCHIIDYGAPAPPPTMVPSGTPCAHLTAVPVRSILDGQVLAALCPRCDRGSAANTRTRSRSQPWTSLQASSSATTAAVLDGS